jgi:hypothetical protein
LEIGRIFRDKWSRYRSPAAIGLDASRFDQHVSRQALEWEHSIYNGVFQSGELRKLLKWQLANNVVGWCRDGSLRYRTDGVRMSGDMNTAMGNCLLMCSLVHSYLRERNITASLANNGDDCTVIMESKDVSRFCTGLDQWFLDMGFTMKVEKPVYDIEGIEFCQTHPINLGNTFIMVRNFPNAIAKDCLSLKQMESPSVYKAWLKAVGEGGLALTGGIPVYQEFYQVLLRSSERIIAKRAYQSSKRRHRSPDVELTGGMAWLSFGMKRRIQHISPITRHSFYLAFGCTPDQQVALEAYYATASTGNVITSELDYLPNWF